VAEKKSKKKHTKSPTPGSKRPLKETVETLDIQNVSIVLRPYGRP
jgi:hypothetical protein